MTLPICPSHAPSETLLLACEVQRSAVVDVLPARGLLVGMSPSWTAFKPLVLSLVTALIATAIAIGTPVHAQESLGDPVVRIGGADRVATAVAVSEAYFDRADTVVLATAGRYPDALAAGPLARSLNAPVLLTRMDTLPAAVLSEIKRLGAVRVVVIGQQAAIGSAVVASLTQAGLEVERIGGPDRFATAAAVAERMAGDDKVPMVVARGIGESDNDGFADALTAGTFGVLGGVRPTLLTDSNRLSGPTARALGRADRAVIVGGTAAVSAAVETAVAAVVGATDRVAGRTRSDTSVLVAQRVIDAVGAPSEVLIATGDTFPDSLVAGALTERTGAPILVVPATLDVASTRAGTAVPRDFAQRAPEVTAFLARYCADIDRATILGLTAAVDEVVEEAVRQLINCVDFGVGSPQPPPSSPPPPPTGSGVIVPDVVGLQQGEAMTRIGEVSLLPASSGAVHDPAPAGQVLSQAQAPGTEVAVGTSVPFVLSLGPELVLIPDVLGLNEIDAAARIEAAGFAIGEVGAGQSDVYAVGQVNLQLPLGGQAALPGTPVDVTVTTGTVNDPPMISTNPVVTHTIGSAYSYDVDATDPDSDPIEYVLQAGPIDDAGAPIAQIDALSGAITWNPTPEQAGLYDFAVRAEDGRGGIDVQSFTVDASVPNGRPNAVDDLYDVAIDDVLNVDAVSGVLANDTDPDDDTLLVAELVQSPANGRVDVSPDGSFTYTPVRPGLLGPRYPDIDLTRFSLANIETSASQPTDGPEFLVDGYAETPWISDGSDPGGTRAGRITLSFDSPVAPTTLQLLGARGVVRRVQVGDRGFGLVEANVELFDVDGVAILTLTGLTFPANVAGDNQDPDLLIDLVAAAGGIAPDGVRSVVIDVVDTEGGRPALGEVTLTGEGPSRNLSPDIQWSWTDANDTRIGAGMVAPTVGDLDGDGAPEVLFHAARQTSAASISSTIYALDGRDGSVRWQTGNDFRTSSSPTLGDLDSDGFLEVIAVASDTRTVVVLDHLGQERARFAPGGTVGNIALADLDGDGVPEILAPVSRQVAALTVATDVAGTMTVAERWRTTGAGGCGTQGSGNQSSFLFCVPIVADIDLDGEPEIIAGNRVFGSDGSLEHSSTISDGFVATGNFDTDPQAEIVHVSNGEIRLLNHDLSVIWGPVAIPERGIGGPPTVGDFDSDGQPEIGVAGARRYVVLDTDGTELWQAVTQDTSSNFTGSTIFDFDDDGTTEVVYRDEQHLWIYDGPSGAVRFRTPIRSATLIEYPIVADIDADGQAEIVVPQDVDATLPDGSTRQKGLYVFASPLGDWVRARPIWNQHSYHVTNVNSDGSIPAVEQPNWLDPRLNNYRENSFPQDDAAALDSFTYRVTDGAEVDEAVVYVDTRDPENAPEITCRMATTVVVGFAYASRVCAIDSDLGDTLTYAIEGGPSIDSASGAVTWDPAVADVGERIVTVTVTDSTGRTTTTSQTLTVVVPVTVPDVVGAVQADARATVEGAGLGIGDVDQVFDRDVPAGTVVAQNPVGGAAAAPGHDVDLVVSAGPAPGDEDTDGDGVSPNEGDCDDTDGGISPNAADPGGDGIDSDCDGYDGVPPSLTRLELSPTTPVIRVGETVALTARAVFDDDTTTDITALGSWSSLSPAVLGVDGQGRVRGLATGSGTISVVYRGIQSNVVVAVRAPVPGDATVPNAAITAPGAGTEVTGPVDVVGTASDANLLRWTLDLVDGGDVVAEIATSGDAVTDGVLGRLDPTMLFNGSFELRLTVVDVTGNISTARQPITIAGQLKVGSFALSFTDLVVPAPGLSIEVRRDYDTRDDELGDFGYGWRLGLTNLRVSSSGTQGEGWAVTGGGFSYLLQPTRPHSITITLPDGTIEEFEATTSPTATAFIPPSAATVRYSPRPGTRGLLTPLGNTNVLVVGGGGGEVELVDDLTFRTWDPQGFRYTSRGGATFTLDADGVVQSIVGPNGNTIAINRDGITHSSGGSVVFERDSLDRITAIVDPEGNRQTYAYDAAGDLVAHTDAEGGVTRFRYTGVHDIVEVIDPLGRLVERREYDADGRLTAIISSGGERTTLTHDLAGRREIVTDADGNTTTFSYDTAGNVLSVEDPFGAITVNTYDGDGNRLTTTDPLGRTTTRTFDADGNALTVLDAAGGSVTRTYDDRGQLLTEEDALGRTSTRVYDDRGNVTSTTDPSGAVTEYSYDSVGNLISTTAPDGVSTVNAYDRFGRQVSSIGPDGATTMTVYDAVGNPTAVVGPRGGRQEIEVDGRGHPSRVVDASGAETLISLDHQGVPVAVTGPGGVGITQQVDAAGNPTAIDLPDGARRTFTYTPSGAMETETDADGGVTTHRYDALDRRIATVWPDGSQTSTAYDLAGQVSSETDRNGGVTTFTYDSAGRWTSTTNPAGATTRRVHDLFGNVVEEVDPVGGRTLFGYDDRNQLVRTTLPDGSTEERSYDAGGNLASITNQAGATTTYAHDAVGRIVAVTDPLGEISTATYDAAGNQSSITDANGNTTRYDHDVAGRLVATTFPTGVTEVTTYDSQGLPVTMTDRNGGVTNWTFDPMGRPLTSTGPDGQVRTLTYDGTGALASSTEDDGTTTFTVDAVDQLTGIANPDGTSLAYTYDPAGNRTSVTGALVDGTTRTTSYAYDAAGRMVGVTDDAGATTVFDYDAAGRQTGIVRPNGTTTDVTYDVLHRSTRISHAGGAGVLEQFDYQRNATGDPTQVSQTTGLVATYSYDAGRRLIGETHADGAVLADRTYGYDAVSNRTMLTDAVGAVSTVYSYDADDRMRTAGDLTFNYDGRGAQLSATDAGGTTLFGYDPRGLLTNAVLPDGTTVGYTVDNLGIRTAEAGVDLLVDPLAPAGVSEVLLEHVEGRLVASYTHGTELISVERDGVTTYAHTDEVGSVRLATNAAGSVVATLDFTAFGEELQATGTMPWSYGFGGERQDTGTGLYHLRARQYQPETGRFTTVDPDTGTIDDPRSRHPYLYAEAAPLSYTDPTGRASLVEISVVSGIIGGISAALFAPAGTKLIDRVERFGVVAALTAVSTFAIGSLLIGAVGAVFSGVAASVAASVGLGGFGVAIGNFIAALVVVPLLPVFLAIAMTLQVFSGVLIECASNAIFDGIICDLPTVIASNTAIFAATLGASVPVTLLVTLFITFIFTYVPKFAAALLGVREPPPGAPPRVQTLA